VRFSEKKLSKAQEHVVMIVQPRYAVTKVVPP